MIESVKVVYTEDDSTVVSFYIATINGKTLGVPVDPGNTEYIAIQTWLAEGNTPLTPDEPKLDSWETIRQKRDQLIRDTDWTMIPGASVDQAQWAAYRQILRDLPQTYTNPEDVVWPVQPSTTGPNTAPVE